MTATWLVVAALFVGTVAIKAAGPLAVGGRRPPSAPCGSSRSSPPRCSPASSSTRPSPPPAGVEIDARVVGLASAAVALALRAPMIVVVATAAAATALARLVA